MTITDKEWESVIQLMKAATDKLIEVGCDSVQIVATSMGNNNGQICRKAAWGGGNLYARRAAIEDWVEEQKNQALVYEFNNTEERE